MWLVFATPRLPLRAELLPWVLMQHFVAAPAWTELASPATMMVVRLSSEPVVDFDSDPVAVAAVVVLASLMTRLLLFSQNHRLPFGSPCFDFSHFYQNGRDQYGHVPPRRLHVGVRFFY